MNFKFNTIEGIIEINLFTNKEGDWEYTHPWENPDEDKLQNYLKVV